MQDKIIKYFVGPQRISTHLEVTVVGVVATNATMTKEGANKVAQMAHNALAKTIVPPHTMFDGATITSGGDG